MSTHSTLDLRGIPCPKNTAKALMTLQMADTGERLEILVDDGEPVQNMISSFDLEPGLKVLSKDQDAAAHWRVLVEKVEN